jgi:hypothetical protein
MYGVVLWSDSRQNRAVIWCEDHGDLAYYEGNAPEGGQFPELDPGDLVRFEVREGRRMRTVSNPHVVAGDQYPTLAGDLARAGARQAMPNPRGTAKISKRRSKSKIIPLTQRSVGAGQTGKHDRSTG